MASSLPDELAFTTGVRPNETLAALLIPVVRTAEALGFFETLATGLNHPSKQVVYTHQQKLQSLVASLIIGCRHLNEIQTKLVPDTVAAGLFGMARFPDQSQLSAFLRTMGPAQVRHLAQAHAQLLAAYSRIADRTRWLALADGTRLLPVDLDQTPLVTRSQRATGAGRGYLGRKRGHWGYQKSLVLLGGAVQEVLWLRLDPANVHGQEAVPDALAALAALLQAHTLLPDAVLLRGDSQYGAIPTVRHYQAAGHHYLVKGYSPEMAARLAATVPAETIWTQATPDSSGRQVWYTDLGGQALRGSTEPASQAPLQTRVVLVVRVGRRERRKHGRGAPGTVSEPVVQYEHYLTDLPADRLPAAAVVTQYAARATEESFLQSEQTAFGAQYLRTYQHEGEAAFLWLLASTVNLLRWVQQRAFAGTPLETAGLTKLVTQALRIPGTIITTATGWMVRLPATARIVRAFVTAWANPYVQLSLPFAAGDSP
jgi:hypothetical protein